MLAVDLYWYPPHNLYIYMGYLTHWGHLLSICYLGASLACAVTLPARTEPSQEATATATKIMPIATPTRLVRATWALYSLAAPLEVAICLLYWSAVAAPGPSAFAYASVMEHGGVAALVLLDGNLVGRVPIRVKQMVFLMLVCFCYLVWSAIDAALGIGNGEWGPAYTDDALYPVLNWNSDRETAATVSAVAICLVAPGCFGACWCLSLLSRNGKHRRCGWCCCAGLSCDGSRRPLLPQNLDAVEDDSAVHYKALGDARIV